MTSRTTKKVVSAISPIQFDESLSQYAKATTREASIAAKLDASMARIREQYAGELLLLQQQKQLAMEVVETFCREQKSILFGKRRSMATMHGLVGFRLGTPKLKTARGSNWDTVLQQLKEKLPAYVRTIEEPAKDQLLADRSKETVAPLLPEIGLMVTQEEHFFIALNNLQ